VVGVLLGQDNGKIINVANTFGIPFEDDEKDSKTWFLDHNYFGGMYEMFNKINGAAKSVQVGVNDAISLVCNVMCFVRKYKLLVRKRKRCEVGIYSFWKPTQH